MAVEKGTSQIDRLAQMPLRNVPSGCDIPIELFVKYVGSMQDGHIMTEFGAGDGEKTTIVRKAIHGLVIAADINKNIETQGYKKGFFGYEADVRRAEIFYDWASALLLVELHSGVFMEGVLCNQHLNDWKFVLEAADIITKPTGYILIGDIFNYDSKNDLLPQRFRAQSKFEQRKSLWLARYENNQRAAEILGLTIAPYEFMVAKPGKNKHIEWGDAQTLVKLLQSDNFERWAQHLNADDVIAFLDARGLSIVENSESVFKSRQGMPLNGRVIVAQKGEVYRYRPWHKGYTLLDDEDRLEEAKSHWYQSWYMEDWINQLFTNVPNAHYHFPFLLEMKEKITKE